tara:strand:+ start:42 stop:539 length:498 start_codon:yes stop_codon:yes gene_type:complete
LDNIKIKGSDQISSNENKTPLQKVGAFLKEARRNRSLSIEDLASSLRIGQEQLIALENGKEDLLPEKVFIKAMVRRISEKLEVDVDFILEELNGRVVAENNIYNANEKQIKKVNRRKRRSSRSKFSLPIIIIISGLLGLISSNLLLNFISRETTPSTQIKSNSKN